MKLIIVLCTVGMAASWPIYEDPNQNWGIYIPPEPEHYEDDFNPDYNRPIQLNPFTTTDGSIYFSPTDSPPIDIEAIMKKFYEENPSFKKKFNINEYQY
ncbi:hypothetical protein KQX54_003103 [Cotesia glomerata]|uniref:Uncharacterized protein n=1 Tax=Cotesia glomerata TaxID=32391 RepID=A0AAV7IHE4_COTGL|nr:hypothetical protein KQX54_003103 [Cotesia glomerata]